PHRRRLERAPAGVGWSKLERRELDEADAAGPGLAATGGRAQVLDPGRAARRRCVHDGGRGAGPDRRVAPGRVDDCLPELRADIDRCLAPLAHDRNISRRRTAPRRRPMAVSASSLTLPAPAKINLFLHVTGRRDDGFHTLETMLVPIDFCDCITLSLQTGSDISRTASGDA